MPRVLWYECLHALLKMNLDYALGKEKTAKIVIWV